jgi:hypothetical protein
MLVSNFSVGYRSTNTSYTEETRYSLQITNLDPAEIRFTLEFHISLPERESHPVAYVSSVLQADGLYLTFARRPTVVAGRGDLTIASKGSVTVTLRKTVRDDRELMGFVILRVPPAHAPGSFRPGPQADHDVEVLLHARREDRRPSRTVGVVDPQGVIPYRTGIGDNYSSESVAISTGRAANEISPEGRLLFGVGVVQRFVEGLASGEIDPKAVRGMELLPDDERIPALLDLLHALSTADESETRAVNQLLERGGVPLRIRRES